MDHAFGLDSPRQGRLLLDTLSVVQQYHGPCRRSQLVTCNLISVMPSMGHGPPLPELLEHLTEPQRQDALNKEWMQDVSHHSKCRPTYSLDILWVICRRRNEVSGQSVPAGVAVSL